MIHAASSLRRSVWALAIVAAMSPVATFAATPQQIVDANLQRLSTNQPASLSGEIKITVNEKPVAKNADASNSAMSFHFNTRTLPNGNAIPNAEGDVAITSFESSSMGISIPSLTNPGTIEWKLVDGVGYVRISQIADYIAAFLDVTGVDTKSFVGPWLKLDPSNTPACTDQSICGTTAIVAAQSQANLASVLKSPIKITKTEKTWKAANGDSMIRVRGIVNTTMLNDLKNREIKAIGIKEANRSAKIKAINTRYAELRKITGSIQFALNINTTDGTIERAEIGTTNREPVKSCTTNKWKITTCKTTANVTTTFLAGMNFAPGKTESIVPPSTIITIDDIVKLLQK